MRLDVEEFREAFARTRGFLLSHHLPGERYRCYSPRPFGRRVHICARCAGIYPGIAAGALAAMFAPSPLTQFALIALLPGPALVDWTVTSLTDRRGYNVVRTATGALLGYGYGLGLARLASGDVRVLGIGAAYALAAGVLLAVESTVSDDRR